VDVRIGVTQAKEIEVDLGDGADADAIVAQVEEAVAAGGGMLWLTDRRGRRVGVPAAKVAYVELDSAHETRKVGFGVAIGRQ
jgi:hypothetical protein